MDGWQPHVASAAMSVIPRVERTTIYLDAEQRRRLRSLAASSGRSRDQLIREVIDRYLGRRDGFRLPSWVGAWADRPSGSPRAIQHRP
jgi:Ribbon-helix-helix protein, copG family